MTLTDKEKAALLIGMDKAFKATRYPKGRNKERRADWVSCVVWAHQMLDGGCFNPLHIWAVRRLAEEQLREVKT